MTIAQAFVTYATCWWLVLFMVLPFRAKAAENPGLGHARGAPTNPMIRKKALWATGLAILPTVVIYFFATEAKAEDAIYTTKSGCKPLQIYKPADDVAARDGYSTHGKQVKPATTQPSTILGDSEHVNIPLLLPAKNYLDQNAGGNPNPTNRNVDLSQSFLDIGNMDVNTKTGETLLNGQPVGGNDVIPEGCEVESK